jgi:adenylate cyclase
LPDFTGMTAAAFDSVEGSITGEFKLVRAMKRILVILRQRLGTTQLARLLYRHLPSGKRCKECLVPFVGVFAVPFRLLQIRPSRKNPNLCTL